MHRSAAMSLTPKIKLSVRRVTPLGADFSLPRGRFAICFSPLDGNKPAGFRLHGHTPRLGLTNPPPSTPTHHTNLFPYF